MLCNFAANAYEKYGKRIVNGTEIQRGMLVNYESLPGVVPRALLPLFGIREVPASWLTAMTVESKSYSKSSSSRMADRGHFGGDSHQKEARANEEIRNYATSILQPTYDKLNAYFAEALKSISSLYALDNKIMNTIPEYVRMRVLADKSYKHSTFAYYSEYSAADPFASKHKSESFTVSILES